MAEEQVMGLLEEFIGRFDTKTRAIEELNSVLGKRYDLKQYGKWRRGEIPIPHVVEGFLVGVSELLKD